MEFPSTFLPLRKRRLKSALIRVSFRRRALGKKVVNRSVSFMSDHDDNSADDGDDEEPESDGSTFRRQRR